VPSATTTIRQERLAVLALVVAAALFGTSFVVMKDALDDVDPVPFLAIRFTVAAIVLLPFALRRRPTPGELRIGVAAGLVYLGGYLGQTIGLSSTTPSTAAFLTYLLVVFVPLIAFLRTGLRPGRAVIGAIAVSLCGLVLLTGAGVGLGRGEVLVLGAAVLFAWHIIQVGDASHVDPIRFSAVQCVVAAVPCLLLVPLTGGMPRSGAAWGAGVYVGIAVTVCTMVPWAWAQQHLPPTRAALVLLLEPVFAAAADVATGGSLTPLAWVGAALILGGAALAETFGRVVATGELVDDRVREAPVP
jgi:drug/metabolite transporter (DMT)-like permease